MEGFKRGNQGGGVKRPRRHLEVWILVAQGVESDAAGKGGAGRKGMSLTCRAHMSRRGERKGAMAERHKPKQKT
jgi:hypothetical protein